MKLTDWVKQVTKVDASAAAISPSEVDALADATQSGPTHGTRNAPVEPLVEASSDRWCGFIDRVTLNAIEGWAQDTYNPDVPAAVELVTSRGRKVVAIAHMYRKDVEEAGFGAGQCGFFLDLSKLQLTNESVIVRFVESKHPITRRPIEFDASKAVLTTSMPESYIRMMEILATETRQAFEDLDTFA